MAKLRREKHPSSMEILPIDILSNILSRIPTNDLLRSKSVCKTWRSLITTRQFANLHLHRHSLSSSDRLLIFSGEDHSLYSINLDTLQSPAFKIPFPSIWDRFNRKNIIGSCNGLLLCICDENLNSEAILINPSTLPCRRIPKLQVPLDSLHINYGFAYDSLSDDYKVMRIVDFLSHHRLNRETRVYSLNSDSWKSVEKSFPLHCRQNSRGGSLVNDCLLHWLFWCSSLNKHQIGCFDVCTEQWGEVALPDYYDEGDYYIPDYNEFESGSNYSRTYDMVDLGVLDGCLCLLIRNTGNVWIMKEYGVKDSWVKLFDIIDLEIIGSLKVVPIAYSKEGSEILLRRDLFSRVFWYDFVEKTEKTVEIQGLPDYRGVSTCVRTLVPLVGNGQRSGS